VSILCQGCNQCYWDDFESINQSTKEQILRLVQINSLNRKYPLLFVECASSLSFHDATVACVNIAQRSGDNNYSFLAVHERLLQQ
jgi:hypothetical protein